MQEFLSTDRLVLRRFTAADLDNLLDLDNDPEVMRYLSGAPTPRDVIEHDILPRFLRSYEPHAGRGYWAAEERATGAFLGWFGFNPPDESGPDVVELGYRLRRFAWGKGYATEGARALIRRGFIEHGVRRVFATTYQDNLASRRVMEKLGMTLVRRFRVTPAQLVAHGTYQVDSTDVWDGDDVEYALERDEWERRMVTTFSMEQEGPHP
jgi:RimJ/RimL family protein N-acetyltransferase